jgi:hypothetical protein
MCERPKALLARESTQRTGTLNPICVHLRSLRIRVLGLHDRCPARAGRYLFLNQVNNSAVVIRRVKNMSCSVSTAYSSVLASTASFGTIGR